MAVTSICPPAAARRQAGAYWCTRLAAGPRPERRVCRCARAKCKGLSAQPVPRRQVALRVCSPHLRAVCAGCAARVRAISSTRLFAHPHHAASREDTCLPPPSPRTHLETDTPTDARTGRRLRSCACMRRQGRAVYVAALRQPPLVQPGRALNSVVLGAGPESNEGGEHQGSDQQRQQGEATVKEGQPGG